MNIYIVGAHSRARTLARYIKYLEPEIIINAYLVNNEEDNPEFLDGIPVIHFDETTKLDILCPVYLGVCGVYHKTLIENLQKIGVKKIIPITVEIDMQLRNRYLNRYFESIGKKFLKIDDLSCLTTNENTIKYDEVKMVIYVVKTISDKVLNNKYKLPSYSKYIQGGAVLTKDRIGTGSILDSDGDNISHMNRQFCELTALYWIWKNSKEDIVGLEHYRRHFIFPINWKQRMIDNDVDVILPVPLYVEPSIEDNYKERHIALDWECMMKVLKEIHPKDYPIAKVFFKGNLYSPCNMFIMKKEVLKELCNWMFPVLYLVKEYIGEKTDPYQNRYLGFLSERLITFFFEKNSDKYKRVYADKNFLI